MGQLTLSHSIAWESTREDRATTDHSGDRSCRAAPFARVFKSEISKDIFHGSMSFVQKLLKPARGRTLYFGLNYGLEVRVSAPKSGTMII